MEKSKKYKSKRKGILSGKTEEKEQIEKELGLDEDKSLSKSKEYVEKKEKKRKRRSLSLSISLSEDENINKDKLYSLGSDLVETPKKLIKLKKKNIKSIIINVIFIKRINIFNVKYLQKNLLKNMLRNRL